MMQGQPRFALRCFDSLSLAQHDKAGSHISNKDKNLSKYNYKTKRKSFWIFFRFHNGVSGLAPSRWEVKGVPKGERNIRNGSFFPLGGIKNDNILEIKKGNRVKNPTDQKQILKERNLFALLILSILISLCHLQIHHC